MSQTVEAARGKWKGILTHFGIDPKVLEDRHQKCPICGGKDRYRFDDKDGAGTYFCSGCGPGTGIELLMKLRAWDFKRAAGEVDQVIGWLPAAAAKRERTDAERHASLKNLLDASGRVVPGTATWNYLTRRCGDPTSIIGELRNHPCLRHSIEGGSHPAMLAKMRYPDGKGASVHRTFLTPEGEKAHVDPVRKIMSGFPLAGSSVRLGRPQERLGVAEGIETAICAGKLHELTVWSAISANGLQSWIPPEGVRSVAIFGDNDASFTGQEAAYGLAKRLKLKGFDVEVLIPANPGVDWADIWSILNVVM